MKTTLFSVALLISISLVGCKPKETALSGQAFIVTRGGENIKLGLLEVQLIEKDAAKEFIQKKQPAIEAEIAGRQSNFLSVSNAYEKAKADYNAFLTNNPTTKQDYLDLKSQRESLEQETSKLKLELANREAEMKSLMVNAQRAAEFSRYAPASDFDSMNVAIRALGKANDYKNSYEEWLEKEKHLSKEHDAKWHHISNKLTPIEAETEEQRKTLKDELDATASKIESLKAIFNEPYPKADTYFTNSTPVILQKAVTDADGRFLLTYPRDKRFSLFAKAERVVGKKTERYYWLVDAPAGVEKAQLFLSNNNRVWIDPDRYFKIKPVSDLQESTTSP